ncbi:TadE/TadG family type IV pilus assembly protein [Sphingomonas sp.]|uniref:TadE/TadG family type IV pilus assembly protein n=1 Tax=Sphingomonas sp. TaxID=28214 RepID=UPI00286CF884|nr:TadE/TadG family type IV pilus assembly protein [Sphingomonas sp.]
MTNRPRLAADRDGTAAAEMALVLPLLLALLFGTFELGNYFLAEHVVQKGVRDAARYAARLPMVNYPSCVPTSAATAQIQRVARTGRPDSGGASQRLEGWTADTMTTVTLTCTATGTYTGIYTQFPTGVTVVEVKATVPYPSLLGTMGIGTPSLTLGAASQSAVYGA